MQILERIDGRQDGVEDVLDLRVSQSVIGKVTHTLSTLTNYLLLPTYCTCSTCEYLSMNMSAFGTLESPRWMRDEPTQHPVALVCTLCSSACTALEVCTAACTRCRPWPVSRSS